MKWLLLIFALLLAGVLWLNGKIDGQQKEIVRLRKTVDSLEQIVAVRQWVDRRNFSKLISNVQWHNLNAVLRRPQIKHELDKYNEHWQLWMGLGEE